MVDHNENTPVIKVVLVGESGSGKTSIMNRYLRGVFKENVPTSLSAIGETKKITCSTGEEVILNIWDTAGQELYRSINTIFYRDAKVILIVYDITDKKSFDEIQSYWYEKVKEQCDEQSRKYV